MEKKEFITQLANFLQNTKCTMNVKQLADLLNWNNYKTNKGNEYSGKRGTLKLIQSVYHWHIKNSRKLEADNVAFSFLKNDRTYAYEK